MKTILFTPSTAAPITYSAHTLTTPPLSPLNQTPPSISTPPKETVRHILLGSPGAVRQTIHLLHTLNYAETVLWSPLVRPEGVLAIAPEPGEAMSLLRKSV